MKQFNQKLLSASVSMLMTVSICQVTATQASDIDIYKLPDQTKLSIFMMLDRSGSMDAPWMSRNNSRNAYKACDVTSSSVYDSIVSGEISGNGYTKNFCRKGGTLKYYYWDNSSSSNANEKGWYKCGNGITNTPTTSRCTKMTNPSMPANTDLIGHVKSSNYYIKYDGSTKYYDRISRLKDALYALTVSDKIPATTEIGIGTFSDTVSINLPTIQWGEVGATTGQREKVLEFLETFSADGNTYTSLAYGQAARYMLQGYSSYPSPLDKVTDPRCSGKGIYFLTDGEPNGGANSATAAMKAAIGKDIDLNKGLIGGTAYNTDGLTQWKQIGAFARDLNTGSILEKYFNSAQRKNEHVIKTAVVGFGSTFEVEDTPTNQVRFLKTDPKTGLTRTYYNCSRIPLLSGSYIDARNACYWGNKTKFADGTLVSGIGNTTANPNSYGEGGFYSASSTQDVITSFTNFVEDMKPNFDPIPTGSPTIPIDALNPIQLQPYGYYASFTPKPQEVYQLWLGNLNKYHIYNGELYNAEKTKPLIQNTTANFGQLDKTAFGIWGQNGMLGKIPLGSVTNSNVVSSKRTIFTNRSIDLNGSAQELTSLNKVNLETLFDADPNKAKFANDSKKNYWLNALGYGVAEDATSLTVATLPDQEVRQLGAVMHSKPILLTQSGKIVVTRAAGATKPTVTTSDRKDYMLFGTTQGMLHVVEVGTDTDADRGKEVFAFVPNEMMENQPKAFLSEGNTKLGKDNLYYGVDAPWTAYTQYVSQVDQTLTVSDSGRKDNDGNDLALKGLQWVYGGLRMGGRSYYALDLSEIDKPTLKFHINPTGDGSSSNPQGYMGESWSKPTIAWVNWGGVRKLVMFVGGGYDRTGGTDGKGYENPAYEQTNKKGAGVYMFDAGDGSLLWWSSANVGTTSSADTNTGIIATKDDNLKYSVVSQINAVDRDSDGLVDHLYFGDLGGQAFRIDINNKAITKGGFTKRVVRLFNAHVATGASPRFYEMPSFSVHSGVDGLFGALALSSGNRSSPLAGTHRIDGSDIVTTTANDAVYVIYDNDVARSDLYGDITLRTSPNNAGVNLSTLVLKDGVAQKTTAGVYNGGWKYNYNNVSGKYKGMNELYALDSMLYVNVFHKDGTGIAGDCGSGVVGDTELYQFCLPTGKCKFYTSGTIAPNKVILGGGILGTGLGLGYSNKSDETGLVTPKPDSLDCDDAANKNKPECQLFDTGAKLQHLRWYESR